MSDADLSSNLSTDDVEAIIKIHNAWLDAERVGDTAGVVKFCTPGVIWIPPNEAALEGQAAIRDWLATTEAKVISLEVSDVQVRGSSTVAYKRGNYRTSYLAEGNSEAKTISGTHLWILIKSETAGWRVDVVTWSLLDLE
jgi:ketosteroid isomerase-like protein